MFFPLGSGRGRAVLVLTNYNYFCYFCNFNISPIDIYNYTGYICTINHTQNITTMKTATITAAQIKTAELFEIEVAMSDLNRYGSWDFSADFDGRTLTNIDDESAWRDACNVRIQCQQGAKGFETLYSIREHDGHSWISNWAYQSTGDDNGTVNDIISMIRDGVRVEIISYDPA